MKGWYYTMKKSSIMNLGIEDAKRLTAMILEKAPASRPVTKLPIDNVVFGRLDEIPLLEMMINLSVITKEHVEGTIYDKNNFQMVFRIINGKLLMRGQDLIDRPDAYAWKTSKVLNAKNKRNLGFHSTEGALTYAEVLSTITNSRERELFTDLLVKWGTDLLLIHTDAEDRRCIPVTKELINMGFACVVNSYDIEYAPKGATEVEMTPIYAGDALILESTSFGTGLYVVRKKEFELTYEF